MKVALSLLALTQAPRAAHASDTIALERFQPAPAGDRFLGLPSPYVAGELDLHAMLLTDYAYKPLQLSAPITTPNALVSYQIVVHAQLALALYKRVLIDLDVPALSVQAGDTVPALNHVDFGDIRLGGRVRLFGEDASPLQLGIGGYLWLPSGSGSISSDGTLRGAPYLSAGGLWGALLWTATMGAELRAPQLYRATVKEGSSLDLGVGLGYLLGAERRLQLGLEGRVSFVVAQPSSRNLNAELLFQGRYRFLERFAAGIGLGPGLSEGVGTPAVRGLVFLAYVPVAELEPRPKPSLQPEQWPSGEGVFERSTQPADFEAFSPAQASAVAPNPSGARVPRAAPKAQIRGNELVTSETGILFAAGSAVLQADAEWQIHALADLLIAHPEIRMLAIRGHADIHGTLPSNARLGTQRAEAVRRALLRHSVEPDRLVVTSEGAVAPAAPSTTSHGLQLNRRVDFWILERSQLAQ